jgi:hypothetical protein
MLASAKEMEQEREGHEGNGLLWLLGGENVAIQERFASLRLCRVLDVPPRLYCFARQLWDRFP